MAGGTKDGGNGRRKSMNLFGRSALSSLTPINTDTQSDKTEEGPEKKKDKKKLSKRSSIFGLSSLSTSDLQAEVRSPVERSSSPKARPRTLQKGRPTSIFGSLGRKSGSYADEELDNLASTPESPLEPGESPPLEQGRTMGRAVTHHGEVQTQSGLFRKKKEYLVLTDSHLIRFKGQSRAYDAFPSIPPAQGRGNTSRHASTASIGSLQDAQSTHTHDSSTKETRIPLNQIVTAYKLEDGRPFFTTEVVFLDEEYHGAGSIQLMLQRPEDADLWHTSIRGAAQKAKLLMTEPYPERVVNYLISALELAQDYYPDHFQIFRVVRRPPLAKGNKSTADDLQKLNASVFYLVIGLNKLHLIPLPDFADPSTRLTNSKVPRESYGLVTLTSMNVQHSDDRFELSFRAPFTEEKTLILAGASNPDIAIFIYKALSYLKPQWTHRTYDINGPKGFLEKVELYPIDPDEEYGGFDRTLTAYCMAYNCNAFNIVYGVDWSVEDAPEWRLYPPAGGLHYTANELLAIMRSLRFNEHFCSISFQNINLQSLCGIYDTRGKDHVALRTRSGIPIRDYYNISTDGSLLYQEIQALALSSRRLRQFDFTNTLPQQRPKDTFDADEESPGRNKDPGCEIVSALFPMCHAELTSVDWVILNGVELGEADLELLGPAMKNRRARFRGFEISRCGLDDRSLNILLSLVHKQCNSIECLNVSDNPGRLNIENFHDSMARYTKIRKLDLSRTPRSLGDAPLLTEEILLSWHLEELYLNGISFNKATLECISGYLMSNASENLHTLQMEQCNMTGSDLALLMMSMTRKPGEGRELTLSVSNNRLENDINEIVKAIQENHTPSHLIMRMIEFTKEDHFKRLLEALRTNKTIKMLDISKASLPYDANQETCEALNRLFAENTTLEELDISGEQSHLEVTRFGIGLNSALTGLTENHTLKTLRIEYQNLGLEGANTLSSVLEKNQGLEEIYCDHNNISLQGFTIIVNALASNHHIQFIEEMRHDEQHFIAEMTGNYNEQRKAVSNPSHVRRTLTNLGVGKNSKQDIQWPDTVGVIRELERSWQLQVDRLNIFLERNRRMAQGGSQSGDGVVLEDAMRPTTALSQKGMLEHILSNTTPKVELDDPVDDHFKHLALESVDGPFGEENDQFQDQTPTKARNHDNNLPQIHRAKMMFEIGDDGDPLFEMEK